MLTFTVGGQRIELSRDDVVGALRGREPTEVRTHAVEVGGVVFPVKQALALVTGLDLLDFTTNEARRVFKALGFRVVRRGTAGRAESLEGA